MTDPSNGQEPSMEDILASIRRIIDEDDRKAAPQGVQTPQADEGDDEVLELTDEVEEPVDESDVWEPEAEASSQGAGSGDEAEPLELSDPVSAPEAAPVAAYGTVPENPEYGDGGDEPAGQENTMSTTNMDRLVSDAALSSAAAALGNLARASDRDPLAGVPQGRPVEELAMELLRPMLREWLDEHLPTIVERIVEREVRYLSRRLGGDDGA